MEIIRWSRSAPRTALVVARFGCGQAQSGMEHGAVYDDRSRMLEVGMIITVEPGIYISEEADVPAQYKGIGVRIEDNLLMTEYGNKNLTAAAPKEIDDIENLMKN